MRAALRWFDSNSHDQQCEGPIISLVGSCCSGEIPPFAPKFGTLAQLEEHFVEAEGVTGSIPVGSTKSTSYALVAQLDRVPGFELGGCGFESCRGLQLIS